MQPSFSPVGFRRTSRQVASRLLPSSLTDVKRQLSLLKPMDTGVPLIRLGGEFDGGYLLPDDFLGVGALFSPGVSDTWDFEREVGDRFGIPSYMVDASVDAPEGLTSLQQFDALWLGRRTRGRTVCLSDWVDHYCPEPGTDLILQMDIEGAEYGVLEATPSHLLRRFRIIVVEYHGLNWVAVAPILKWKIGRVWRKLSADFEVAHVHPNNSCPVHLVSGVLVPQVLEVTYLRRDRCRRTPGIPVPIQHALDRDCVPGMPPVELPADWPP